jgi:hypothetical protein
LTTITDTKGWTVGFGHRNHIYTSPDGVEYRTTTGDQPDVILKAKTPGVRDTKLRRLGARAKAKLDATFKGAKKKKKRKVRTTL